MIQSAYSPNTANTLESFTDFAVDRKMLDINTIKLCKIVSVDGDRYSVVPLVQAMDSSGNEVEQPTLHDIVASQVRGSKAGIIIEYKADDIVVVGFCDSCISPTKDTLQSSKPEENRKFALQDGVILGYFSNDKPTTYIKITDDGIEINTSKDVVAKCNNLTATTSKIDLIGATSITGNASIIGNLSVTGAITSTISVSAPVINGGGTVISSAGLVTADGLALDSVTYKAHIHSGGTLSSGTTGGVTS